MNDDTLDDVASDLIERLNDMMFQDELRHLAESGLKGKKLRQQVRRAVTLWNQEDKNAGRPIFD